MLASALEDMNHYTGNGYLLSLINVMNSIALVYRSLSMKKHTGKSDYFLSNNNGHVIAMMTRPRGEVMSRIHSADRSDKAQATKGSRPD